VIKASAVFHTNQLENKVRAAVNETPGPETGSQPETPVRKPWHAPRLTMTELASTYAVSNAGSDIPITIGTSLS
jgi:hypothetical protein